MKKLCLVVGLLLCLGFCGLSAHAESEPIKVTIGTNFDYADIYMTEDKQEMSDIVFYLDALWKTPENPVRENFIILDEQKDWYISVHKQDGTRDAFRLDENWFYIQIGKNPMYLGDAHRFNPGEFERFRTLIARMKSGETTNTVLDAECSEWAKDDIETAHTLKFTLPWNEANYTLPINRLEVCQIAESFLNARGIETNVQISAPFDDTSDLAVAKLYHLGVINGKTKTEFAPYDLITREELAKVLGKIVSLEQEKYAPLQLNPYLNELKEFKDEEQISDWAKEDVYTLRERGILQGKGAKEFVPKDYTTKEEVITCFNRISLWWDTQKLEPCGEKLTLEDFAGIRRGMDWNFVRYFIGDGISIGSGIHIVRYYTDDGLETTMWMPENTIPELRFYKKGGESATNEIAISYNADGSIRFPTDKELTVAELFQQEMLVALPETGIEKYTYNYWIEEIYEDGQLWFVKPYIETDIILNEVGYAEMTERLDAAYYRETKEDLEDGWVFGREWETDKATQDAVFYSYVDRYAWGTVSTSHWRYVYIDSIGEGLYRMRSMG